VQAIERGFQKNEIETSAYRIATQIDSGERVVVGLNRNRSETEDPYEPLRLDPAIEQQQADRLARLRDERDNDELGRWLGELRKAAEAKGDNHPNVLVPMREALRAKGTVGEVCDALREVWGVYRPPDAY
jgi:methylmalonyl-CoA mutase N-terminal domain/subunit